MSKNKIKRSIRLIVLGDSATGKTEIIFSFMGFEFKEMISNQAKDLKYKTTFKLKKIMK